MAKLFIFAIGGSGSRVVKALTFLMASGVKLKADTIVPIVIDPDEGNGDLNRTEEILQLYKTIYEKAGSAESDFFSTRIKFLDELGEHGFVSDNVRGAIDGVRDHLFKEFIGYAELDQANKAVTSLLFSRLNLDANMDVGFKGNPNIGSVVLNKFRYSDSFRKFAETFGPDDRVFIISSIFGGTGAAGFPLILKNIRDATADIPNHMSLKNAMIGAVTILPYFNVSGLGTSTSIDSDTFITKTKAALNYYARNISGNNSLNALYYIGDNLTNNRIDGADGAAGQKNNAHFIELAAALSIVDFMEIEDAELRVENGQATQPKHFEFGIEENAQVITFAHVARATHHTLALPLTQYALFHCFLKHHFDEKRNQKFAVNGNHKLQGQNLDKRFYQDLEKFNAHFGDWLREMSVSTVAFKPFNIEVRGSDILNIVNGSPEKQKGFLHFFKEKGLEYYVSVLNKVEEDKKFDAMGDVNKKLLAVFSAATKRIATEKINL
jgi:hypothetical protein